MSPELVTLWQTGIGQVLLLLIGLFVPMLIVSVILLVKANTEVIRAKLPKAAQDALQLAAIVVTSALEQESISGAIQLTKKELRAEGIRRLDAWMNVLGFKGLTGEQLADALESAIRQGLHKGRDNYSVVPLPNEEELIE